MARERYLVGVSQEELEYTPPPPPPSTFKEKWENFWYHHKWPTIIGILIAAIAVVVIVQAVSKTRADYTVCLVTQQELSVQAINRLQAEFSAVGSDRNEDGKVVVKLQVLNVSSEAGAQYAMANRQAVTAHIVARDVLLFAFDPEYYTNILEPVMDKGVSFFVPLVVEAAGISEDGTYWNWKESSLLKEADMQAIEAWPAVPKELYFGVRNLSLDSEKDIQEQQAYTELLQSFIAAHSE